MTTHLQLCAEKNEARESGAAIKNQSRACNVLLIREAASGHGDASTNLPTMHITHIESENEVNVTQ